MDASDLDMPKISLSEDRLYRGELVHKLCKIIKKCDVSSRSYTIGICGKWGSGKTSVVNFLKNELKEDDTIRFITFTPWMYSSQEDITFQLLNMLASDLKSKYEDTRNKVKKLLNYALMSFFQYTKDPLLVVASSLLAYATSKDYITLDKQKNKIMEQMKEINHRIVVVIDDVDRLVPAEINMIVKLVRSVADFPNIVYILCYDDDIVDKALSTGHYQGHEYIQKIIDMPIRLPSINSNSLLQPLVSSFKNITNKEKLEDYENEIMFDVVSVIDSLRDVNLLIKGFEFKYGISAGNTCAIDLLALTAIEMKDPLVHDWINENWEECCGIGMPTIQSIMNGEKNDLSKEYEKDGMNVTYLKLLKTLFPSFDTRKKNIKGMYRISNPQFVGNYFLLTPSSLQITDEEVRRIVQITDPVDFFCTINSISNNHKLNALINIAIKYVDEFGLDSSAKQLSDIIISQDFKEYNTFSYERFIILMQIPELYLSHFNNDLEKIQYLESLMPHSDIHKIINCGTLVHRYFYSKNNDDNDAEIEKLYFVIVRDIINSFTGSSTLIQTEFQMMLIIIKRYSPEKAKEIFLQDMPDIETRKELYDYLIKNNYSIEPLVDLVGDRRYLGTNYEYDLRTRYNLGLDS